MKAKWFEKGDRAAVPWCVLVQREPFDCLTLVNLDWDGELKLSLIGTSDRKPGV